MKKVKDSIGNYFSYRANIADFEYFLENKYLEIA